jgi:hypothetical protein
VLVEGVGYANNIWDAEVQVHINTVSTPITSTGGALITFSGTGFDADEITVTIM